MASHPFSTILCLESSCDKHPKDVAEYRYQDIVVKPMSLLLGAEVDNVDLKANLTDLQEIEYCKHCTNKGLLLSGSKYWCAPAS